MNARNVRGEGARDDTICNVRKWGFSLNGLLLRVTRVRARVCTYTFIVGIGENTEHRYRRILINGSRSPTDIWENFASIAFLTVLLLADSIFNNTSFYYWIIDCCRCARSKYVKWYSQLTERTLNSSRKSMARVIMNRYHSFVFIIIILHVSHHF